MTASVTEAPSERPPVDDGRRVRTTHKVPLLTKIFGKQPVGIALVAPYVVFIAVVFAFPLGFAIWMSFHDYYFTAPG